MTGSSAMVRDAQGASASRLVVPDVLRGIAIVAMLIAHAVVMLPQLPGVARFVTAQINDVASPLFALVMGISAQIVWNRRAGITRTIVQQTARGAILIALGVWMATWGSWVAIVLQYLGLLLILGVPLLLLRTRMLVVVLVLLALATQPVLELVRASAWVGFQPAWVQEVVRWLFLGHSYRLVNLLPFFLLGALLLRHGFSRDRMLWIMAVAAPVAWLARPVGEHFLLMDAQSGDYLDTLHDVGLVFAVYVVVVLISGVREGGFARVRDAVFGPLRVWGQLALSLYLLHVAVIAAWATRWGRPQHDQIGGWLLVTVVPLLLAWLWGRFVGVGPVEWLMGVVTGRPRSLRR